MHYRTLVCDVHCHRFGSFHQWSLNTSSCTPIHLFIHSPVQNIYIIQFWIYTLHSVYIIHIIQCVYYTRYIGCTEVVYHTVGSPACLTFLSCKDGKSCTCVFVYWCTCVLVYTGVNHYTVTPLHQLLVVLCFLSFTKPICLGKRFKNPPQISSLTNSNTLLGR